MKKINYILLSVITMLLCAFTFTQVTEWKIAEDYVIRFTSKDPSGVFTRFSGDILFDTTQLENARFNLSVDPKSINTGNGMKNKHARSEEWLDADLYPEIKFVSGKFSRKGNLYEVIGILDLHGIQKEVTIPFTFDNNIFKGNFVVNRLDYKIGKTKGMYGKVATDLQIDFAVPVTKK